jgi:hypothetical protein
MGDKLQRFHNARLAISQGPVKIKNQKFVFHSFILLRAMLATEDIAF